MVDLSGLVHPRAAEFFQDLMNRQAEAAMAVTGAPATTWTGRYSSRVQQVKLDLGTRIAMVTWDGDIEYDAKVVIQPIWRMCRWAGRKIENYHLSLIRNAFRYVFHENLHTVNQQGRTHGDQMEAFQDPENRALEEGLTELCARRFLNDYLRELGVVDLAPGILTANAYVEGTYPHFVPAVEVLVERLGERTGLGEEEILQRLITIDCESQWQVIGDLLFDAEGLAELVPEADHAMVKSRLVADLRQPFRHLAELDGSIEEIIVASAAAGHQALGWFDQDVEALRLEHDPTRRPEQVLERLLQRQEHAALAVTGAHHLTPTDAPVTDLMLMDGTTVGETLREMCEHAGEEHQPPEVIARYKEAFHVILERNIRQSADLRPEVGMDADKLTEPGVAAFSEGLARALADDRLNAYVDQLGLEQIAPRIRRTPSPRPPDRAAVAARAFVQEIGAEIRVPAKSDGDSEKAKSEDAGAETTLVEMDRDVLLRQLAGQDPPLPWQTVTRLVFGSQEFREYLDWTEFDDVKTMIQNSMTESFARIAEPVPSGAEALTSAKTLGRAAALAGRATVAELDQALRPPVPAAPEPTRPPAAVDQVPSDARIAVGLLTTGRSERSTVPGPATPAHSGTSPRSAPRQTPGRDV
jgi:hypothetical protein